MKMVRVLVVLFLTMACMASAADLIGPQAPEAGAKQLRSARIQPKRYDAQRQRMVHEIIFVHRDGTRESCPLLDTTAVSYMQDGNVEGTWAAVWPTEQHPNEFVSSRYKLNCRIVVRTKKALEAWQELVAQATQRIPDVLPIIVSALPKK